MFAQIKCKHRNKRQNADYPGMIVIHAMGEYIETGDKDMHAKEFLDMQGLSAHYLVTPSGVIIECADPEIYVCYHARGYNAQSIGVEFLVPGVHTYATFINTISDMRATSWCVTSCSQYKAGVQLVGLLYERFYSNIEIVRHSDLSPNRKQDPGPAFPWEAFKNEVTVINPHEEI